MPFESNEATWDKRFKAKHYSYRDFMRDTTTTSTLETYVFGTNARAISNYNWPTLGDWTLAVNTYARSVMIQATTDTWIRLVSVNPYYLLLINQGYSTAEITGRGITQYINEVEQIIPTGAMVTFYPTYGYSIEYRFVAITGTIYVFIEGNGEGNE